MQCIRAAVPREPQLLVVSWKATQRRLRTIATSLSEVATACTVALIITAHSKIDMFFLLLFVSRNWRDVNRARAGRWG